MSRYLERSMLISSSRKNETTACKLESSAVDVLSANTPIRAIIKVGANLLKRNAKIVFC